jgi:hypothetical protein
MNTALVGAIVRAVLYEGYMLYPYRPSAVKNRQRFNFGVVYPRAYSVAQGGADACTMRTECLVQGDPVSECAVRVRFLRVVDRSVTQPRKCSNHLISMSEADFELVQRLEVDGKNYLPWQEAVEETIEITQFNLVALAAQPMKWPFRLSPAQQREAIRNERGEVAGIILRNKATVSGTIELSAQLLQPGLFKLTVLISNESRPATSAPLTRELALSQSLLSAHTILENPSKLSLAPARTSAPGQSSSANGTAATPCFLPPSFFTTIRKSLPRVRAIYSTARRSMKYCPCAS